METKKNFGAYICRCRKELGLTQREFADRLYVTESAVSKWERGLSYPDITLIRDICAVLGVTEHELLTASEDVEARTADTLAKKYLRLARNMRLFQFILYGGIAAICLITNLAVDRTLSWFWIVLTAELMGASLTLVPVLAKRRRGMLAMGGFTVSLELLLLASCLFSGGDWFALAGIAVLFGLSAVFLPFALRELPGSWVLSCCKLVLYLAVESVLLILLLWISAYWSGADWFPVPVLPAVLYGLAFPWGMALLVRYLRANGWWQAAGCLGIGVALMLTINMILDRLLGPSLPGRVHGLGFQFDFSNWTDQWSYSENVGAIVTIALVIAAIVCAAIGLSLSLRRRASAPERV